MVAAADPMDAAAARSDQELGGVVLRIERSAVHDGVGIRTVVFLKGCPMRCRWCSTPESQSPQIETAGQTVYGAVMTVGQVMKEVRKDAAFYFISGGGLTLSGGEPLAQPAFARALLKQACSEGLDTALETSLFGTWDQIKRLTPYTGTVFADLKLVSPERHRMYCGQDNQIILKNLRQLGAQDRPCRLVVRIPIVPGINDDEAELGRMADFCRGLHRLDHVQLLPYHRLGVHTYEKLDLPYPLKALKAPSEAEMARCRAVFRRAVPTVI